MASQNQKMKVAAIEAMWHTEKPPASFTVFGLPDLKDHVTRFAIKLPWVLGLVATRSVDETVPGIDDLEAKSMGRIESGIIAYGALERLRHDSNNAALMAQFDAHKADLGYALLLKRYTDDPVHATNAQIEEAARDTVPDVPLLFWSFRFMVGLGFYFIALFTYGFYLASRRRLDKHKWFLRAALWSLPLPWIACELGWIVAEVGRQPWTIDGVLPTFLSVSSVTATQVSTTLAGFVVFYTALLIVDMVLMVKYIRLGPSEADAG